MDKTAIQLIQETAIAAHNIDLLDRVVALPRETALHSLEPFHHQRARFRGRMSTDSADSFIRYCNERANQLPDETRPICFVYSKHMQAHTFFNFGDIEDPGHCDDTALLELEKTAPFSKLLTVDEHRYEQRAMQDFIEDWRDHLTAIDADGETVELRQAIAAISDIDIKATQERNQNEEQFASARSGFEKIEASSRHELPYGFEFECIPYHSLESRVFTLRLSLLTGHDKPYLSLRLMQREKHLEEIAEEFKQLVSDGFDNSIPVYIGSFDPRK